ncbi:hypothetical protein PC9H_009426 [Pleurotus ostreatus]|uniref:FAD/NAD(P)-binding domain-containing protein n=1 Tax=Pleurotus ostreatus TaxID=5322 RepID=A0A8H7DQN3_PLEOS|nr:uncharacterized protein PC9H_009426 [Pleurotus ostreatus]KAF7424123.1 hypothetical protein PC9H_009426 [Pleurotus ostreatus]
MTSNEPRVVVIGAGLAGISTGIALKQQLNCKNFTIYEKANNVGGTWRGCGSDVPGHWYSLSTELNPHWSTYFAGQPELQAYWEGLFHKHGLVAHTQFNTLYKSAVWDADAQLYRIVLEDSITGAKIETQAHAIVFAMGGFARGMYPPEIRGRDVFKGAIWHSAEWDHGYVLEGKRVGVIGNGCSVAQFLPKIAADPTVQVVNFCRTPQWFVPAVNSKYPGWVQTLFAYVPGVMRLYRNIIMARGFTKYLKSKLPKEMLEKMTPSYPPGCKRIIVDVGYLDALQQPNVTVNWDGIDSIVEGGIKTKTGEVIELDAIIFGTGYVVEMGNMNILGRNGRTVEGYYAERGGPTAYLGTCIPGFPNVFTLLGPNTATGHASVIFTEEAQINLAVQLLQPILEGKAKSFEVTDAATNKYDEWLQRRLATSVWTECHSYYQSQNNYDEGSKSELEAKPRIVATFPGPVSYLWWMLRKPVWGDYIAVGAEPWFASMRSARRKNAVMLSVFSALLGVAVGVSLLRADGLSASVGFADVWERVLGLIYP